MSNHTTIAPSCKDSFSILSRFKGLAHPTSPSFSTPTRLIAQISAAGLVLASAGFGAVYAWSTGSQHGLALACLMTVMAVALELAKPLSVAATFAAFRSWRLVQGIALLALAAIAIAYSLSAELSLMATARGDKVAERAALSDAISKAHYRYDRATSELSGLSTARPSQEVEALISGLLLTPGADGCAEINGKVTRQVCPQVAELKAELARSNRRSELEASAREAERKMMGSTPSKTADPGASALATYLAVFGFTVAPAALSEWLVLIGVLALEIGSAFAGILAQSFRGPARVGQASARAPQRASPDAVANRKREIETALVQAPPVQVVHPVKLAAPEPVDQTRQKVKRAIVQQLKASGGSVSSGERGLAKLIGANRSTMKRAINGLVMAGVIAAEATRNGTMLRLVA